MKYLLLNNLDNYQHYKQLSDCDKTIHMLKQMSDHFNEMICYVHELVHILFGSDVWSLSNEKQSKKGFFFSSNNNNQWCYGYYQEFRYYQILVEKIKINGRFLGHYLVMLQIQFEFFKH